LEEDYLKKLVVALGGNAILKYGEKGTFQDQISNLKLTATQLAPVIASWYQVVITHGNGPQVGNILIQNERAKQEVPPMPLDVCGAQSQGQIGYFLQQVLNNELRQMGKSTEVAAILTQTVVDPDDPAFSNPSKPIGPWLTKQEMLRAKKEAESWTEDLEKGWRRKVPSPRPVRIHNAKCIETMLQNGFTVVACGGGGIPVIDTGDGILQGIEAVIDKDLASQCIATDIRAHILMILTDVPAVYLNFGTSEQSPIGRIHVKSMRQLIEKNIFPAGSIGPKVEAAVQFVEKGGEMAIVASIENAEEALKGKSGTVIIRG